MMMRAGLVDKAGSDAMPDVAGDFPHPSTQSVTGVNAMKSMAGSSQTTEPQCIGEYLSGLTMRYQREILEIFAGDVGLEWRCMQT